MAEDTPNQPVIKTDVFIVATSEHDEPSAALEPAPTDLDDGNDDTKADVDDMTTTRDGNL